MKEIRLKAALPGNILDVGGGGEGVIGRFYGRQVIAIDNRQDELDELPDCCEKLLMDATCLHFPDDSFDTVTFFYSLMYMTASEKGNALQEAARVLKPGGSIHIWDARITTAYPDPFVVSIRACHDNERIETTYGIITDSGNQDRVSITAYATRCGLHVAEASDSEGQFYLHLTKMDRTAPDWAV